MVSVRIVSKKHGKGIAGIASLLPGPNAVKIGFPAGKADGGVVARAIYNEFGTRGGASGGGWGGPIPERPFMRNSMRANRGKYQDGLKASASKIIRAAGNGENAADAKRQALQKLGVMGQGDIKKEITALASPPNSPVTVALKGSSKPLIDSGEMRAATTWKIEE